MARHCIVCGKRAYSNYCVQHKPRKAIKQRSDKQMTYEQWLNKVARPYLIERDGNKCSCCGAMYEPFDIDHIISKGTRPDLKKDLNNLQLICRFPCHHLKTIGKPCVHN